METFLFLIGPIILVCVIAFPIGILLLLFKSTRKLGARMTLGALAVAISAAILAEQLHSRQAIEAGFKDAADMNIARQAGIADAKGFYADGVRDRIIEERREAEIQAPKEAKARELAARADREAADAAAREKPAREARAAVEALTELAVSAPLDQQPPMNPQFGSSYYNFSRFLRTAAGYPFVRMSEAIPICETFYAAKEAADAVQAKDAKWIASIRGCTLFTKDTAVEWTKDRVGGLPVVELRIKSPEGSRITAYAPSSATNLVPSWMKFYDIEEMRARRDKDLDKGVL